MHLVSPSLLKRPPLTGNFIGKGGAHADGTKSSGDKVHHISPLKLLATIIYSSFFEFSTIRSLLSLSSTLERADTSTIFLTIIPYLLFFKPPYFRTLSLRPLLHFFFCCPSGLWTRILCC